MNYHQDTSAASLLLAQFYKNLVNGKTYDDTNLNLKIIRKLLEAGFNINEKFPDNFLASSEPVVSGGNPLHFVYSRKFSYDIFKALIENGADFTLQNANGQTVLHYIMQDWHYDRELKPQRFINSVLSAHVTFKNASNPRDNNGLSHFHCACIMDHTKAVEFFLANGVLIDQVGCMDLRYFCGYTALHYATEFSSIKAIKILLDNNANPLIQDEEGMTPLHILIKSRICEIDSLRESNERESRRSLAFLEENEKMMILFLEKNYSPITSFYAACTLKDVSWVNRFIEKIPDINLSISMNTEHWASGYTAMHFAADCNIDMVKFLLEKGGNIVVEDDTQTTPLNNCFRNNNFQDVCNMLSNNSLWNNTLMSDGKTRLVDVISSMESKESLRSFLNKNLINFNSFVPNNSPFWPGYTCLHVALVTLRTDWINSDTTNSGIIQVCLDYGADVNIKNAQGQTPIHLAFHLQKHIAVLLRHLESLPTITDIRDENDLSYLQIACTYKSEKLVERLLPTSDVNLAYKGRTLQHENVNHDIFTGFTALHFAIGNKDSIVKLLIDNGADIEAKDICDMTPIHWIIGKQCSSDVLFNHPDLKDFTTKFGLNYLHVAAFTDNGSAVTRLINLGSKVDAIMDCKVRFLVKDEQSYYLSLSGLTPMELALHKESYKAFSEFLKNGVEMSDNNFKCTEVLQEDKYFDRFVDRLLQENDLQKNVAREMGLTRLHIACYCGNTKFIKILLEQDVNVNARIHDDSKVFAGSTPLHLLLKRIYKFFKYPEDINKSIEMLSEKGADVTLVDRENNTPIHLSLVLAKQRGWVHYESIYSDECTNLLLSNQHNFNVNPMDANGMSHFHVACLFHNVEAVEGFLEHGVDVNQPIDLFCEKYAKFTPLHLAFEFPLTKFSRNKSPSLVVNILLRYGADVNAQNALGDTPLHGACRDARANLEILRSFISLGADIHKENLHGETPFELLLSSSDALDEQITFFLKHGSKFDDFNRLTEQGCIGIFISANAKEYLEDILGKIKRYLKDDSREEMDRTPIHNIVAVFKSADKSKPKFCEIIKFFLHKGIDIDQQDNTGNSVVHSPFIINFRVHNDDVWTGKTALHYATQFGNGDAVRALLELGADINIVEKLGKSAFSYALDRDPQMKKFVTSRILFVQICLRKLLGLEVSQQNENLTENIDSPSVRLIDKWSHYGIDYKSVIEKSKRIPIKSTSLTLYDFLSGSKMVVNYMYMPKKIRDEIDKFFELFKDTDFHQWEEIITIMSSQYNKAVARVQLIEETIWSLRRLLGFSFPGLCEDILMYLSNTDLKNVIKSIVDK